MKVIRENYEYNGGNLVASIGMFDGVHRGHQILIDFLKNVARRENLESAIVTFGKHPQQVLHPKTDLKMLMTLDERLNAMEQLGVDIAIVKNFNLSLAVLDSYEFMKLLRDRYRVSILVVGYNHRFGHNTKSCFKDYVQQGGTLGVKVIQAPEYQGIHSPVSSSVIRKLITTGKVDDAMACLGRPFSITGTVGHGLQNGREIGFPTANIENVPDELILPHRGAYAVKITLESGEKLDGMANIGVRPTIETDGRQTIEVHLFDFGSDIYGQRATISFVKFLRTELKKDSFDELRRQLQADERASREILTAFDESNV